MRAVVIRLRARHTKPITHIQLSRLPIKYPGTKLTRIVRRMPLRRFHRWTASTSALGTSTMVDKGVY